LTIPAVGDGISTFDYLNDASYGPCAAGALA